jgi:hypothetical protein
MGLAGKVARIEDKLNAYRLLVKKPEGKRPLGRPRRRWAGLDTITMVRALDIHLAGDKTYEREQNIQIFGFAPSF